MTLGIGTLAFAAMLAELWRDVLSKWLMLAIVMPPVVVFLFVHPGELPERFVRIAHVAASLWYAVVALGLFIALLALRPLPEGWPVLPLFVAIGAVPCGIVLYRAAVGSYHRPSNTQDGRD